jgi:hypothetical protein
MCSQSFLANSSSLFRVHLHHLHSNQPGKRQHTVARHENQHTRYIYQVLYNIYRQTRQPGFFGI